MSTLNIDSTTMHDPNQSSIIYDLKVPTPLNTNKNIHAAAGNNSGFVPSICSNNSNLYTSLSYKTPRFLSTAEDIRHNIPKGAILISRDLPTKTRPDGKLYNPKCFALLDDYLHPFNLIKHTPRSNNNFYEVVCCYMDQKPRFDLDFPPDRFPNITYEQVYSYLWEVLNAINDVMTEYKVPYSFDNNCLVFNSHGLSGDKMKYSFHIIIDKLVHHGLPKASMNEEIPEARAFYLLVVNKLSPESRALAFLDSAVYSSFQNFRLPWCEKQGSNRPKVLDPITTYVPCYDYDPKNSPELNEELKSLGLFRASLLSFSSDCSYLPSFITPDSDVKIKSSREYSSDDSDLTKSQYDAMITEFNKQPYSVQYYIGSSSSNKIYLNRSHSGRCPIKEHDRVHDGIGASLVRDEYGNFWFNCLRYDNGVRQRGIRIGSSMDIYDYYNIEDDIEENNDICEEGFNMGILGFMKPPILNNSKVQVSPIINGIPSVKPTDTFHGNKFVDGQNNSALLCNEINTKINCQNVPLIESNINRVNTDRKPVISDNLTGLTGISWSEHKSSHDNRIFSTNFFINNFIRPLKDKTIVLKDLFNLYNETCNKLSLISEHTSQTSFTKFLTKTFKTTRIKKYGKMETAIVDYCLNDFDINNIIPKQEPTVNDGTILLESYIRDNLLEFRSGYITVKRLYTEVTSLCMKNKVPVPYNNQKAFTIDLNKKYGYEIIRKYLDGEKQSAIKGYIHKNDEAFEKLKLSIKNDLHRVERRMILKNAKLLDDKKVRKIMDMVTGDKYFLIMRASCGMSKTERIVEYIREQSKKLKKILFVTNRITLADKHKEDLDGLGFKLYYENDGTDGLITGDRLICQIDSIHKIRTSEKFDLVVFDEFVSTMTHLVDFVEKKNACNNMVEEIIRDCDRVIVADALMSNAYVKYIKKVTNREITIYQYTHKPHTEKTYSIISDVAELVRLICNDVRRGKKVVVPTNVEWMANALKIKLEEEMPEIKIGLYTAKTKKKTHKDVSLEWNQFNVVVYSPCITCGVSFTENYFDVTYGYFSRCSCGPGIALQMLFRCRCVTRMRICIENKGMKSDLVCKNPNVNSLKQYKAYVIRNYDGSKGQDLFKRSYVQGVINTDQPFFHLYCVVAQDQGEGFKNYELLLGIYLRDMGVVYVEDDYEEVERLGDEEKAEVNGEISKRLKDIKEARKKEEDEKLAEIIKIDDKTAEMMKKSEKDAEDVLILRKYNICKEYEVEGFDEEFGREARKLMRVHRNVRIYNEVAKYKYGTEEHKRKMIEAMGKMTNNKDDFIYEFEGEKIRESQKRYQGGLCELGMNIIELLKINREDNVFEGKIEIKYHSNVEVYLKMAREFIDGYFREDGEINNLYNEMKYKKIATLVLYKAFGINCVFVKERKISNGEYFWRLRNSEITVEQDKQKQSDTMELTFKKENGKFYPREGEYWSGLGSNRIEVGMDDKEDNNRWRTVEEMTNMIKV